MLVKIECIDSFFFLKKKERKPLESVKLYIQIHQYNYQIKRHSIFSYRRIWFRQYRGHHYIESNNKYKIHGKILRKQQGDKRDGLQIEAALVTGTGSKRRREQHTGSKRWDEQQTRSKGRIEATTRAQKGSKRRWRNRSGVKSNNRDRKWDRRGGSGIEAARRTNTRSRLRV